MSSKPGKKWARRYARKCWRQRWGEDRVRQPKTAQTYGDSHQRTG